MRYRVIQTVPSPYATPKYKKKKLSHKTKEHKHMLFIPVTTISFCVFFRLRYGCLKYVSVSLTLHLLWLLRKGRIPRVHLNAQVHVLETGCSVIKFLTLESFHFLHQGDDWGGGEGGGFEGFSWEGKTTEDRTRFSSACTLNERVPFNA